MTREDLRRMFKLETPHNALQTLLKNVKIAALGPETMPIEESIGRVLAEDVVASVSIPSPNMTFMDGYAVRTQDTVNATSNTPAVLTVVSKLFPNNHSTSLKISPRQAVYVACGAQIPKGADGVIKVEQTVFSRGKVSIERPVKVGENIAYEGSDVRKGSLVLRKRCILRPQDVSLLAGVGIRKVKVIRKPRLAVISVGDEIVEFRKPAWAKGKIVNNYALLISGLALDVGAIPIMLGVVPDDLAKIRDKIAEGLSKAEIVGTIGGCSVGVKDLVPDAINALGNPGVVVHGVSIKPGHVVGAGAVRGKPVVMMPGHVVSTVVAFYLFVVPFINRYLGFNGGNTLPTIRAKVNRDIKGEPRNVFLRVSIRKDAGEMVAEPIHGGSNTLTTLVKSNGFTVLPAGKSIKKGDELEFTLFSKYEYTNFRS